jgi:tellurite resistance protein TehA-like permease
MSESRKARVTGGRLAGTGLPDPGAFAVVMATGIVSADLWDVGWRPASLAMLALAAAAFAALAAATGWRAVTDRAGLTADLASPRRVFRFFTFVVGANLLGVRLAGTHQVAAVALLAAGTLAWLALSCALPAVLAGATLADVDGTWWLWPVGTQSVALGAATLAGLPPAAAGGPLATAGEQTGTAGSTVLGLLGSAPVRVGLGVLATTAFFAGLVLYVAVAALVLRRLLRLPLAARDLTPPYWIAMGAASITVCTALRLPGTPAAPAEPVVTVLAVLVWGVATCLIPLLLGAGIWRHAVHRVPLRYSLELWTIVFPLGMYAMAGLLLGGSDLPAVRGLAELAVWPALTAWTLVALAMSAAAVRGGLAARKGSLDGQRARPNSAPLGRPVGRTLPSWRTSL